jgi:hypothetical protein
VVASQSSSVPVPLGAGPAGCPQAGFSTPRCVSRGFRKNKSGPRAPRPPVPPPVLGFLVRRARRGWLPSTRNSQLVAPQVSCGGIWPFGDLATGAHQLALVLVPITDPQSTGRWQEPVHQAPYVIAAWGELGAKLWTLAVSHH